MVLKQLHNSVLMCDDLAYFCFYEIHIQTETNSHSTNYLPKDRRMYGASNPFLFYLLETTPLG